MSTEFYTNLVSKHRKTILETERYVWKHPESGFKEWNTSKYLAKIFEDAGYTLNYAGDIPGFYTDLDTGRPGPKLLIMGEMDALIAPTHPEAVNNCAHTCGHNCQCAGLVGVALALKEPGALDGLCGSIRLMAVPAEELIEIGGEMVPRTISPRYTASLNVKSVLRRDLSAWRGRDFTQAELEEFNLRNIVGAPCLLQVIHLTW